MKNSANYLRGFREARQYMREGKKAFPRCISLKNMEYDLGWNDAISHEIRFHNYNA